MWSKLIIFLFNSTTVLWKYYGNRLNSCGTTGYSTTILTELEKNVCTRHKFDYKIQFLFLNK